MKKIENLRAQSEELLEMDNRTLDLLLELYEKNLK